MRYRLTPAADEDITAILRNTKALFGRDQVRIYADVIDSGLAMIAEDPWRPSGIDRSDIRPGLRSFHLELVRRRRRSASHLVYYKVAQAADGQSEVVIIGVLHERMEPKRKLGRSLRDVETTPTEPG